MIISDQYKFIFVHIPKTAGSSLRSVLSLYANATPSSTLSRLLKHINLPKNYQQFRFNLHSTLLDVQLKMPAQTFEQYQKIAFVRNPWDRMVSSYAFKVNGTDEKKRNCNDSFEIFINTETRNNKKRQQVDYLRDINGKLNCEFIGRYESLEQDYRTLEDFLGIKLPSLPVLNKSKGRGNYRSFYNEETKALIAQYYQEDINEFGYTF